MGHYLDRYSGLSAGLGAVAAPCAAAACFTYAHKVTNSYDYDANSHTLSHVYQHAHGAPDLHATAHLHLHRHGAAIRHASASVDGDERAGACAARRG